MCQALGWVKQWSAPLLADPESGHSHWPEEGRAGPPPGYRSSQRSGVLPKATEFWSRGGGQTLGPRNVGAVKMGVPLVLECLQ